MRTKRILTVMFMAAVSFSPAIAIQPEPQKASSSTAERQARDRARDTTKEDAEEKSQLLRQRLQQLSRVKPAQKVIGMEVRNAQGEQVAKIDDLVVDLQRGDVAYVILGSGGFAGIGEKLIAVPARKFQLSADKKFYLLDTTKDKLRGAPGFEKTAWPDPASREWQDIVAQYHGVPSFGGVADIPPNRRLGFMKASDIDGMKIKSSTEQNLGKIEDLMVDLPTGKILFVAVEDVPLRNDTANVPPTVFQAGRDKDVLYLNGNEGVLQQSPGWDITKTPDYTPVYVEEVYGIYKTAPDWGVEGYPVDNTKRNVRDAAGDTLTPLDQGASPADREITRAIRHWIVVEPGKDRFSTLAHNIKIITRDGKVTLRGIVRSDAEKEVIERYAKSVAGVRAVDNQLEVKTN